MGANIFNSSVSKNILEVTNHPLSLLLLVFYLCVTAEPIMLKKIGINFYNHLQHKNQFLGHQS